jgi:hypothetical protein
MAYQFKLQVPISKKLSDMAKAKAEELGFGSLNDVVRFLINSFATGKLEISASQVNPHTENIEEIEKLITQVMAEYERGEVITIDPSKPITPQMIDGLD